MKICTVLREHTPNFSGGGVHAFELMNALHQQGHDVHIVAPMHGDRLYVPNQISDAPTANNIHDAVILSELPEANIHLVATTPRRGFGDLLGEILRLHREVRFDVVHIHFVCPLAILAGLIKATNGPPTVVSAHGGMSFCSLGSHPRRFLPSRYRPLPLPRPSHLACGQHSRSSRFPKNCAIFVLIAWGFARNVPNSWRTELISVDSIIGWTVPRSEPSKELLRRLVLCFLPDVCHEKRGSPA
jgi:glycosyltransferase involved in cell wall biosynthesis